MVWDPVHVPYGVPCWVRVFRVVPVVGTPSMGTMPATVHCTVTVHGSPTRKRPPGYIAELWQMSTFGLRPNGVIWQKNIKFGLGAPLPLFGWRPNIWQDQKCQKITVFLTFLTLLWQNRSETSRFQADFWQNRQNGSKKRVKKVVILAPFRTPF